MINVLILTEAGKKKVGYGHMFRCLALAQVFSQVKPRVDTRFIVKADKRAKAILKANKVNFVNLDWVKNLDKIQELIGEETIVIIDSYQAPFSFYKKVHKSKGKPYVVAIDDYNRLRYEVNAIINISAKDKNSVGYKKRKDVEYLVGSKYLLFRKEFWKNLNKRVNKKIKNVLISLGGTDQGKFIRNIVNLLADYDFKLHVVGMNKKIDTLFDSSKINIYSDLNTEEIYSLMQKVDLCVSGGGQLLNELAYLGVPTLALCLAPNQLGNIRRWERVGFVEYIGQHNDKNLLKKIIKAIDKFSSYKERARRSKIGRNCIDGRGALRVKTWLLEKLSNSRQKDS